MKRSLYSKWSESHSDILALNRFYAKVILLLCFLIHSIVFNSCSATMTQALDTPFSQHPEVKQFIQMMVTTHHFNAQQLEHWFSTIKIDPTIIAKMNTPYEAKPWYQYRSFFLKPDRITAGLSFWKAHQHTLQRVADKYGVPIPILLAVLGVETQYGQYRGKFPILQSLSTLAFNYPARASYFKKELIEFLLLCREQGFDPLTVKGSYAGAMGIPQFMPSSYRHYAVGLDGPMADIIHNPDHAIASVGHFLAANGWHRHELITTPARLSNDPEIARTQLDNHQLKAKYALRTLAKYGISPYDKTVTTNRLANLISLENKTKPEYWLGFNNFYVITHYNTSILYAMAVYQLGEAIAKAHKSV